ncbi:MAG: hypothetical protein ACRCWJ_06445 [Casimicrobium sp.]
MQTRYSILLASVTASALLPSVALSETADTHYALSAKSLKDRRSYSTETTTPTSTAVGWSLTALSHSDSLTDAVTSLYQRLLRDQTRLDPEFEQLLDENAWDLYSRS